MFFLDNVDSGLIVAAAAIEGIEHFATFAAMIERSDWENMLAKLSDIKHKMEWEGWNCCDLSSSEGLTICGVLWIFMFLVYPNCIPSSPG